MSARIVYQDTRPVTLTHVAPATPIAPTSLTAVLHQHFDRYFNAHGDDFPSSGLYDRALAVLEKPLIERTLQATGGNQIKAADILGINRNTLRKKIRQLGIVTANARRSHTA